jgi:hypothetical protein
MEEARILADVLYKRDPFRVKHNRRAWGKVDPPTVAPGSARYFEWATDPFKWQSPHFPYYVLDTEPEFMSLEDQQEEAARRIAELRLYEFLCRPAIREGKVSNVIIPLTIANLDGDEETGEYQFPNYERVARLRSALEAKDGIPAATILKEVESALPVVRGDRDGHSPRLREQPPPRPPAPAATADGKREDTAPEPPPPAPVASGRQRQRRHRLSEERK